MGPRIPEIIIITDDGDSMIWDVFLDGGLQISTAYCHKLLIYRSIYTYIIYLEISHARQVFFFFYCKY